MTEAVTYDASVQTSYFEERTLVGMRWLGPTLQMRWLVKRWTTDAAGYDHVSLHDEWQDVPIEGQPDP